MRLNRIILAILTLTILTLASPLRATAAGVPDCGKVYAALDTLVVETNVEVGQVEGSINGAAYLRYDDGALPIDPRLAAPNFVITTKLGNLNLWVYSTGYLVGEPEWIRDFEVLRYEGSGIYAGQRFSLEIYGKCSLKGGSYLIEGLICKPAVLLPKR